MTTDVATRETAPELLERVVIGGDLSKLTPAERLRYYREVCASVGLNPLTKPFEYLHLNGKLILYARRDATDQLRKLHGVSVLITGREYLGGDVYVVTSRATDKSGRTDESMGAVSTGGLKGDNLANALMKAETKSKRRVTLSICGLGMLDETEVETIPGAKPEPVEDLPKPTNIIPLIPPVPSEEGEGGDLPLHMEGEIAAAPLDEWLLALEEARTAKALQAVWKGVTAPVLWPTWSPDEQARLIEAKNQSKKRLGIG